MTTRKRSKQSGKVAAAEGGKGSGRRRRQAPAAAPESPRLPGRPRSKATPLVQAVFDGFHPQVMRIFGFVDFDDLMAYERAEDEAGEIRNALRSVAIGGVAHLARAVGLPWAQLKRGHGAHRYTLDRFCVRFCRLTCLMSDHLSPEETEAVQRGRPVGGVGQYVREVYSDILRQALQALREGERREDARRLGEVVGEGAEAGAEADASVGAGARPRRSRRKSS